MASIADVLKAKGSQVHTISPDATVFEAIEKMVALNIGSLVVAQGADDVRGIVTERDYLRKIAVLGRSSRNTAVHEIMSSPVHGVPPDASVEQCMAVMTELRHRHLLVMDAGRLVGLVSVGDLIKNVLEAQQVHIQQLTKYICADYPG